LGKFLEKFFSGEEIFDFLEDSAPLVMGYFPAKLFRGLGNNGQLKINWATIFLKIIFITQTYAYRREIHHSQLSSHSGHP
jgi:hypothetical protein